MGILCCSCSAESTKNVTKEAPEADTVKTELVNHSALAGIYLMASPKINSKAIEKGITGISFEFNLSIDSIALKRLEKKENTAFVVDVSCRLGNSDKGIDGVDKLKALRLVQLNDERVFSSPQTKTIKALFPYRELKTEGETEINFIVKVYKAKFKAGEKVKQMKEFESFIGEPEFNDEQKLTLILPKIYKSQVTVFGFKLDTASLKAKKYDFAVTGKKSGMPDLFWQVKCGEESVFKSAKKKNTISYPQTIKSHVIWASADDQIQVLFGDEDNAKTFNENDYIAVWKGTASELHAAFENKKEAGLVNLKECVMKVERVK